MDILHDIILKTLQYIIEATIAILVPIVIRFVLTKTNKENLSKYVTIAEFIVKAVEQIYGGGNGSAKKSAAVTKLSQMTKGKLSTDDLHHLIEAAVFEMNKDLKQAIKAIPEMKDSKTVIAKKNAAVV
ncbi:phage holin [Pseudobacteroides cellulosolvens]|uniref:Phage holin, LL-H family n=1 Tax=Pseudobacteroides cellulosolvens ATCC 35603 = DSM 2933 TaxID=398512 RepID=A0A0L6JX62_9FIRM|nr:phage holin [Pseudobacteroides cellulosolvens]KNY30032.1 phage holin, LL-H family [Pseudobacteroides cellulosolvens ATCC 35603 = DSM 2933]